MKHNPLQRLLKSAALARRAAVSELFFPEQARILAAWRAARQQPENVLPVLRKAILAACAITVVALAFTVATVHKNESSEVDEIVSVTNSLNEAIDLVWTE
jgi:hypothetical protein